MAWDHYSFMWGEIQHYLRGLTSQELSEPVNYRHSHFQREAEGLAIWMKDQIERDFSSMEHMPTLDYIVIVGREEAKPNRVVVIVCNIVEAGPDSPIGIKIKIERWVPNEFVGAKAGGYEVFVIQ